MFLVGNLAKYWEFYFILFYFIYLFSFSFSFISSLIACFCFSFVKASYKVSGQQTCLG